MFEKFREALKSFVKAVTTRPLTGHELRRICDDLVIKLVEADVALDVAEELVKKIEERLRSERVPLVGGKSEVVEKIVREILLKLFSDVGRVCLEDLIERKKAEKQPFVVLFVGPNGHGKTTTIAKIAYRLKNEGYRVLVACSDTFRAGAIEQLEEHCRRVGVKMLTHRYGADPAAVAYDAVQHARSRGYDVVLIDTAGRQHTDINLMEEISKIYRVVKPDLVIFVADSLMGSDALDQIQNYMKYIRVDGIVLTKVDADPKGGAAITLVWCSKRPIVYLGTGQKYSDLVEFNAEEFIEKLIKG